ncbi:hypothetical protein [Haloferula rosea]|uniref:Uncharacterized protein n=1 Tax=Haloferula rosea TaxID=490093 RepID=A0A934RBE0_9BACT|nr:hypothetical protein [Haloferula rosea]MBK1827932.1 hypothetical protein [Haloferula rosea]
MITKALIVTLTVLTGSASADFVTKKNTKGAYYEVHKNRDGSHSFYLVPSSGSTGGQLGSVTAWKDQKIVFMADGITNHTIMSRAVREGKVRDAARAFCVTVRLDLVDKITLLWAIVGPPESVSGTTWDTDLLWLLEEARKDGRFRDYTTKAKETVGKPQ